MTGIGSSWEAVAALVTFERLLLVATAGHIAASPSLSAKILWCRNVWAAALRIRGLCRALPLDVAAVACASLPDPGTARLVAEWAEAADETAALAGFYGVVVPFATAAYAQAAVMSERASPPGVRTGYRDLRAIGRGCGRSVHRAVERSGSEVRRLRRLATHALLGIGACRTGAVTARTRAEMTAPARGRVIAALRSAEAREDVWFVSSPSDESRYLHQLVAFEINTFEAVSRHIAEFAGMPWEFHWDMARQIRDELAHLGLWLGRLARIGIRLGDHLLSTHEFSLCTGHALPGRLAMLERLAESAALDSVDLHRCLWSVRGDGTMVANFCRVQLDEIGHVRCGNKWLRRLCAGDDEVRRLVDDSEAATRRRMLGEAWRLERAGAVPQGSSELMRRKFDDPLQLDVDRVARRQAGFTETEIADEVARRRLLAGHRSDTDGVPT